MVPLVLTHSHIVGSRHSPLLHVVTCSFGILSCFAGTEPILGAMRHVIGLVSQRGHRANLYVDSGPDPLHNKKHGHTERKTYWPSQLEARNVCTLSLKVVPAPAWSKTMCLSRCRFSSLTKQSLHGTCQPSTNLWKESTIARTAAKTPKADLFRQHVSTHFALVLRLSSSKEAPSSDTIGIYCWLVMNSPTEISSLPCKRLLGT